jgi:hypothetical protein
MWDVDVISDSRIRGSSNGNRVSPGYFATLGTPLLAGRDFDRRDVIGAPITAIVNQSFADKYFNGEAVGRRFTKPDDVTDGGGIEYEVIGLVADQKYLDIRDARPSIFFAALSQEAEPSLTRRYVIRGARPPAQLIAAVGATIADLDPRLAVRYALLDAQIDESMLRERLMARLSAIFGAVALLLAVVGLYGVVSYGVASRRAEIGVRVALGASRSRILSMILGDVGRIMIAGVAVGGLLSIAVGRGIKALLFGLQADDLATLAIAAGLLLVCGFLSAAWPARRAAGTDPLGALREG